MRIIGRILLAAALFGAAVSCSRVNREQLLVKQAKDFHNNLRWKRLEHASIRVVPWEQKAFMDAYKDRTETLQIENFEYTTIEYPKPGEEGYQDDPTLATLKVLRYQYELPSVTREKVEMEEKWLYHNGGWFVYEGFVAKNVPTR